MSSKVFVPQLSKVRNAEGLFVPKFDVSGAEAFGQIVELLGGSASPSRDKDEILAILAHEMAAYQDQDFILCIGSPIIIGWTVAMAAGYNEGRVTLLEWNRIFSRYEPITAELW